MGIIPKEDQISEDHQGFKTITKKSLHFRCSRYRECLMEIAMLCEENQISNFIDNVSDL